MQKLAQERGGECLSKRYRSAITKLRWRCKKGHEWSATPNNIKNNGHWCPKCRRVTIEEMQRIAEGRGGKCLSKRYRKGSLPLEWICIKGHKWKATPDNIKKGHWCPKCAHDKRRLTIDEMKRIAKKKKGECLSTEYQGCFTPLEWRCQYGHTWNAAPANVKHASWCPYCAQNVKLSLADMNAIAESWGGKCLSKKYVNNKTKLEWQCAKGHKWHAVPDSVKHGYWCPTCAIERTKLTIEEMREIARERGGECLSKKYQGSGIKLTWKCAQRHTWPATPQSVKKGTWCPKCWQNKRKLTLEDMRMTAQERGGECLSKLYLKSGLKLNWKCSEGHTWRATPDHIRKGSWCPTCAREKQKLSLEGMREVAREKKGECLSKRYKNVQTHLTWKCSKSHTWKATPSSVLYSGSWCPICSGGISEKICRILFERIFQKKFPREKPAWLIGSKGMKLELGIFTFRDPCR